MAKKFEFNVATVKRYLFWVCVPLGLAAAMILGTMAVGEVGRKLEDRKKQLESQKTAIDGLHSGAATHPNQGTIDEIDEKREELAQKIMEAWITLEKDQKEQNRWEGLGNVAREIEGKNFLDTLSSTALNIYLNFARDEMKKLIDKADIDRCRPYIRYRDGREEPLETNEPALTGEGSGGIGRSTGRGGGVSMDTPGSRSSGGTAIPGVGSAGGIHVMKGKVVWSNPQVDITMSNWNQQPQSFEVWLTQEDLWVYQALLWVVAQSNKDVKVAERVVVPVGTTGGAASTAGVGKPLDLSGSVIKEIVTLAIGKKAADALAAQSNRRVGGVGGGLDGEGRMPSGGASGRGGAGRYGDGMGGSEATRSTAMAGRYVDDAGNPLMDADLAGQLRRMPIYLRFVVDQRRISDVLVNCANCPMPIDVLWVTANFSSSGSGGVGGGNNQTSGRRGAGAGAGAGTNNEIDFGPDAVTVDIYGCINIFTPPDAEKITADRGGE